MNERKIPASVHKHHHIRSKQDVKNPWKAQACLYSLVALKHTYPEKISADKINTNISSYSDFGPTSGQAEGFYRSCIIQCAYRRTLTSLISAIQCADILLWQFPGCLASPSPKISPETHFSHFSQSWNVGEPVNWALPSCSALTSQHLHSSWCLSKKHLSSSHHSWARVLLFNWGDVPSDTEVLVLIPQATPGHA